MKNLAIVFTLIVMAIIGCENGDVPEWQPSFDSSPIEASDPVAAMTADSETEPAEIEAVADPVETAAESMPDPEPKVAEESLEGVAQPTEFVELSVLVAGLIDEVHVREGQKVKANETLISLDARVPAARLAVAEADARSLGALRRAEVNLRVAELYLKRLLGASPDAIRPYEVEEAEGKRDEAKAVVQEQKEVLTAAKATRDVAAAQLKQFEVTAPFNGTVIEIHQRSGVADPRNAIIKVANLDRLEVEMYLPSKRFGKIKVGDELQLKAAAPVDRQLVAKVVSVSPLIDSASNTFRCLLEIDNTDGSLPAGFAVRLSE